MAARLTAAGLAGVALAACGATTDAGPARGSPSSTRTTPSLATSLQTPQGSWAVVPMGRLDQPLNTFWQLLFRAPGSPSWVVRSASLAVATNGGLVVVPAGALGVDVGIRPANLLSFSPLLARGERGQGWRPLAPVGALADSASSLAVGEEGRTAALSSAGTAAVVSVSAPGAQRWDVAATSAAVGATSAGRACNPSSLTSVGWAADQLLVGADCREAGVVGIVARWSSTSWRLAGPALPAPLARGRVDVLGLRTSSGGVGAVITVTTDRLVDALVAWKRSGSATWRLSRPLSIGTAQVRSTGPVGTERGVRAAAPSERLGDARGRWRIRWGRGGRCQRCRTTCGRRPSARRASSTCSPRTARP